MLKKPMMPPCATWQIWEGREVEGASDIGERTLFIRSLKPYQAAQDWLTDQGRIRRCWLCEEFSQWSYFADLNLWFPKVCVAVRADQAHLLPAFVHEKAQIYLKVPVPLKAGDYVCVGHAYQDEALRVGGGYRVTPQCYEKDIPWIT